MEPPSFQLQNRLIETRKVFPFSIEKIYQHLRVSHIKALEDIDFEESTLPLIDIPDELFEICNSFDTTKNDEVSSKLLDQMRIMIILAEKKKCRISKIIDAI